MILLYSRRCASSRWFPIEHVSANWVISESKAVSGAIAPICDTSMLVQDKGDLTDGAAVAGAYGDGDGTILWLDGHAPRQPDGTTTSEFIDTSAIHRNPMNKTNVLKPGETSV